MTDNLQNRGAPDRTRIRLQEEHEVRYWTQELGISEDDLRRVVGKAGDAPDAVLRFLES
jgi:hypothetical protein